MGTKSGWGSTFSENKHQKQPHLYSRQHGDSILTNEKLRHRVPRESHVVLITHGFAVARMRKLFLYAVYKMNLLSVSETVYIFNPCPETYCLAQERGKLRMLLFQHPKCWDYRYVSSYLAPNQILNNVHILS